MRRVGAKSSLGVVLAVAFWLAPCVDAETPDSRVLDAWLARQAEIETWTAKVKQIRKLEGLLRPLETEGAIWFERPNRFRWQLGDPPRTIAVRTDAELLLVYPRLRQAERYRTDASLDAKWEQALALLEVGLPSDRDEFHARYQLLAAEQVDDRWHFELQPAEPGARQLVRKIRLELSEDDLLLHATELIFPDESKLRNELAEHRFDPPLEATIFAPKLGDDYEIVEPLAKP